MDDLIPVGKYKGQPIAMLANDKQYADWLVSQSWFKEKYFNIYQVVINNFKEPSETPEHNAMQIRFLDSKYSIKLATIIDNQIFQYNNERLNKEIRESFNSVNLSKFITYLKTDTRFENYDLIKITNPVFEDNCDVHFSINYGLSVKFAAEDLFINKDMTYTYLVEIKPTISDDFPAVLRQIKNSMKQIPIGYVDGIKKVLLTREYTGIGATKEDFLKYFATQGIHVIFENEVDSVDLSEFDFKFKLM